MHWVLSSDSAGDAVLQKAVAALSTPANLAKFNTAQVKTLHPSKFGTLILLNKMKSCVLHNVYTARQLSFSPS